MAWPGDVAPSKGAEADYGRAYRAGSSQQKPCCSAARTGKAARPRCQLSTSSPAKCRRPHRQVRTMRAMARCGASSPKSREMGTCDLHEGRQTLGEEGLDDRTCLVVGLADIEVAAQGQAQCAPPTLRSNEPVTGKRFKAGCHRAPLRWPAATRRSAASSACPWPSPALSRPPA